MRSCRFLCFWVVVCFSSVIANAQGTPDSSPEPGAPEVISRGKNTFSPAVWISHAGDLRRRLSDKGVSESLTFTNDWSMDLRGRGEPGTNVERCLMDLSVDLDTRKLFGWSGGSALLRVHSYQGENGSARVGDAQGFSNIDDVSHTLLYELWFEQRIPDTNWRARVGKIDANTLFATVESGIDFLNSSMGHSPTILKLPTYPEPRLGGNVLYDNNKLNLELGIYDVDGSGSLALLEAGHRFSLGDDSHTRTALGLWQLRTSLPSYDGSPHAFTPVSTQFKN